MSDLEPVLTDPWFDLRHTPSAASQVDAHDSWAIVHLTWSMRPETPPYPRTHIFTTVKDLEEALNQDA